MSFPAKVLEYLASGTIAVCSDIDPHQRLVRHGENGYLYDGTVDGLVSTLDTVVEERSRHREIEEKARETALEYDWDAIVGRHERILLGG